jgi:hypothetical protein
VAELLFSAKDKQGDLRPFHAEDFANRAVIEFVVEGENQGDAILLRE